jgi:hypothetical protein
MYVKRKVTPHKKESSIVWRGKQHHMWRGEQQ